MIYLLDEANIYMYNYKTNEKNLLMSFRKHLIRTPDHFVMNKTETICFISCSSVDSIFVDLKT